MKKYKQYAAIITLIFLSGMSLSAQTSEELDKKYGKPIDNIYKINEKVFFSVKYGEDKEVCQATISRHHSLERLLLKTDSEEDRLIMNLNEDYYEFMRNFFPFSKYGKLLKDYGGIIGNCYTRNSAEYENIFISSHIEACQGDKNYISTTLMWKRDSCKNLPVFFVK